MILTFRFSRLTTIAKNPTEMLHLINKYYDNLQFSLPFLLTSGLNYQHFQTKVKFFNLH